MADEPSINPCQLPPLRAAFEAFAKSCGLDLLRLGDVYHDLQTHIRWCVWQAADAAAVARERERCAVVCEATGEIACQMYGDGAECLQTAEMCADAIREG